MRTHASIGFSICTLLLLLSSATRAQTIVGELKISDTAGGFTGALVDGDELGASVCVIGDVDGDGVTDLAIGMPSADGTGTDQGVLWIVFRNPDGTVKSQTRNDFPVDFAYYGISLTPIGTMFDPVPGVAIGIPGLLNGRVWGLLIDSGGDVYGSAQGATFAHTSDAFYGRSVDYTDDPSDLFAVGGSGLDGGGIDRGAVYIYDIFPDDNLECEIISDGLIPLDDGDQFGIGVAWLGDLTGDGFPELAVSADHDDDGGTDRGAVYILTAPTCSGPWSVLQKISSTSGGFTGALSNGDEFGHSLAALGDHDGDGLPDLLVGARLDDDGGPNRGAAWRLYLNADGTVKAHSKISSTSGGFAGPLADFDFFGHVGAGDLNGDGYTDLVIGAVGDNDGGPNRGALYVLTEGPFASATFRNGTNVNPALYFNVTPPALGGTLSSQILHAATASFTLIIAYSAPTTGPIVGIGELLVDLSSNFLFSSAQVSSGTVDTHSMSIPNDISLLGRTAATQGVILDPGGHQLTNALDLMIGGQ